MQLNISDNPQETDKNAQTKARKRRSQDHKAQSSCKETRIMHRLQESEAGGKDRTICIVTSAGTLNQRVCSNQATCTKSQLSFSEHGKRHNHGLQSLCSSNGGSKASIKNLLYPFRVETSTTVAQLPLLPHCTSSCYCSSQTGTATVTFVF